jgi:hypothetical protein
MNAKSLSGFELAAVRGKWFEVNDVNHSTPPIIISAAKIVHSVIDLLNTILVLI